MTKDLSKAIATFFKGWAILNKFAVMALVVIVFVLFWLKYFHVL